MPDDKTTKIPETAAPDTGPGKAPEQAPTKEPVIAGHTGTEVPGAERRQNSRGREKDRSPLRPSENPNLGIKLTPFLSMSH